MVGIFCLVYIGTSYKLAPARETGWVKFKWRNHQPDIGRFFNVDPLAAKYVHNSPYAFSENKVVRHIELEGLEAAAWEFRYMRTENQTKNMMESRRYIRRPDITPGATFKPSHLNKLGKEPGGWQSVNNFKSFVSYSEGLKLNDILDVISPSNANGFSNSVDRRFQENRYIFDPGNPDVVIDMRHFLAVGGKYGLMIGDLIELAQAGTADPSGLNPQDYYSNLLGVSFFENYDPDESFSDQLLNFFNRREEQYNNQQTDNNKVKACADCENGDPKGEFDKKDRIDEWNKTWN